MLHRGVDRTLEQARLRRAFVLMKRETTGLSYAKLGEQLGLTAERIRQLCVMALRDRAKD